MKCLECISGVVRPHAEFGRRWAFRNIPDIPVPAELAIPTCDSCGATYIDGETAERLDNVLVPAYEALLRSKASDALTVLSENGVAQREMEPLLGLSAGYLSKVRRGKESSGALVSILMLLAADPTLVARLKRLWSVDTDLGAERKRTIAWVSWHQKTVSGPQSVPFVRPPDEREAPDHVQTIHLRAVA